MRATTRPQAYALTYESGGEVFTVLFTAATVSEVLREIGRWAGDPIFPFTWYDAAVMCAHVRRIVGQTGPYGVSIKNNWD